MRLLPFETCRQRLYRAKTHSDTFGREWARLLEGDPYSPRVSVEADGTGEILMLTDYDPLPDIFSLEIGELLYQLRGALDASVYGAAIIETGLEPPPDENDLEFPVRETAKKFKDAAWHIAPLTGERRTIIESVQPYNAANVAQEYRWLNDALALLNDWSRKDRHRKLHIVGSWVSGASPKLRLPPGVRLIDMEVAGDGFLHDDYKVASFRLEGWQADMKIEANPDLMIDIAVDEAPSPRDDSDTLSERCRLMLQAVEVITDAIEASFSDRTAKWFRRFD